MREKVIANDMEIVMVLPNETQRHHPHTIPLPQGPRRPQSADPRPVENPQDRSLLRPAPDRWQNGMDSLAEGRNQSAGGGRAQQAQDNIKPGDREKCYFDSYDPAELEQVINTQKKVIDYQKEQKHKDLYQILICIDDFADSPDFTRKSQLLHQLYIRGRHYMISTITSTQVFKAISPIVRKNVTHLFVYRLRNYGDLEGIIEELSAIYDKKTLLQLYHEAVSEDFSFLYVNLMQKRKERMFMQNFTKYLIPS